MMRRGRSLRDRMSGGTVSADRRGKRSRPRLSAPWRAFFRGASVAVAASALGLFAWSMADQVITPALGSSLQIVAVNLAVVAVGAAVIGALVHVTVARWWPVPSSYIAVVVGALALLAATSAGASWRGWAAVVAIVVVAATVIGGAAGFALATPHRGRRARAVVAVAVAMGVVVAGGWWLVRPWADSSRAGEAAAPQDGRDPSRPGPFEVATLTYGSGDDLLREEFRDDVAFRTAPVDASAIVAGWSDGAAPAKTTMWGFDASRLPLNGRVWYPKSTTAAPLVLLVHGNKGDVVYSDVGLAWLAEAVASRGNIVVSVDENFLNTTILDRNAALTGTESARAWLLLEHVRQWRDNPDNPLRDKVDLSRIALVGHSRGGEAAAAALNDMSTLPDNPKVALDYGFAIRSVIGLAPADGQYRPDGHPVPLEGVNYLVVHGSHDADIASFAGLNTWHRAQPAPGNVKAAAYLRGADHDQFNTLWGNCDIGYGLPKYFIDPGALLAGEQQREIAAGYVSAFLELTLPQDKAYRPLFDGSTPPSGWLPDVDTRRLFADGDSADLIGAWRGPEDTSAAAPTTTVSASGPATATDVALPLRLAPRDIQATRVDGAQTGARLDATVATPLAAGTDGTLRLDLAQPVGATRGLPLTVEVADADGTTATTPLDGQRAVPAPWMASTSSRPGCTLARPRSRYPRRSACPCRPSAKRHRGWTSIASRGCP